jgi:hypothetical protein
MHTLWQACSAARVVKLEFTGSKSYTDEVNILAQKTWHESGGLDADLVKYSAKKALENLEVQRRERHWRSPPE